MLDNVTCLSGVHCIYSQSNPNEKHVASKVAHVVKTVSLREPLGAKRSRTKASKGPQWEPIGGKARVTSAGPSNE
jgi:hypothetical protein